MQYLKHPHLGNQHASEEEARVLEPQGWTRFPRSKEAKAAGPWPSINMGPQEAATVLEPIKRKPGRPKKT